MGRSTTAGERLRALSISPEPLAELRPTVDSRRPGGRHRPSGWLRVEPVAVSRPAAHLGDRARNVKKTQHGAGTRRVLTMMDAPAVESAERDAADVLERALTPLSRRSSCDERAMSAAAYVAG
jgi:hypothetical protein